jgi:hypothetical protein
MSRKVTTAQPTYDLLVGNLAHGSDPSRGPAGNPDTIRSMFTYQHFPEVQRLGPERGIDTDDPPTPGIGTRVAHVDYTVSPVPVPSAGAITVLSTVFTDPVELYLGEYTLISGEDYNVTMAPPVVGEDITNTAPNGALTLFDTAGPNLINVPATLPITPGTVTIHWTNLGAPYSQVDDGAGNFTGDGTPAGSSIDYALGAITLNTAPLAPDGGTFITIDYTPVATVGSIATNLAAAIDSLNGFTATPAGAVVNIVGPNSLAGNDLLFEAIYTGAVQNFGLAPTTGSLAGGEPVLGPPIITP